jgi:hypothetical protein
MSCHVIVLTLPTIFSTRFFACTSRRDGGTGGAGGGGGGDGGALAAAAGSNLAFFFGGCLRGAAALAAAALMAASSSFSRWEDTGRQRNVNVRQRTWMAWKGLVNVPPPAHRMRGKAF